MLVFSKALPSLLFPASTPIYVPVTPALLEPGSLLSASPQTHQVQSELSISTKPMIHHSVASVILLLPFSHSEQNPGSHCGLCPSHTIPLSPGSHQNPRYRLTRLRLLYFLSYCLKSGSSYFLPIFLHSLQAGYPALAIWPSLVFVPFLKYTSLLKYKSLFL